jgi:excisionase family DNA binding protein
VAKNSEAGLDAIRSQYPPILTTAQVAELLGLNVRTVMVMANDGRLPASRLPGSRKYHFLLEDVLATLSQHRIVQTPPDKAPTKAAAGGTRKSKASSQRAQPAKAAPRPKRSGR